MPPSLISFTAAAVLLAHAALAAPASAPKANKVHFDFLGSYRGYYAEREPLCFTAIEPLSGERFGVRLDFDSNLPGLQRIEWAEGESAESKFQPLPSGGIFLPFQSHHDQAQDRVLRVRPVFAGNSPSPAQTYVIRINWMTRAAFTKAGGHRNRDIVKITTEPRLNFGTNQPENWMSFRPNAAESEFARKTWGHVVASATSDYDKARRISKALMRELRGCGGMPSALIYELPTFEKYAAIRDGRSKFACAQFSEIFSKICNAFDVVNRWGFNNDNFPHDEILIELGSSHLVTEIFDRELNQWVFIDGMMNTLGAYLGEVGPLTLHEFFLFINQPNRRPYLNVVIYDPETQTETPLPVERSGKAFLSYYGWTKGYHTDVRKTP